MEELESILDLYTSGWGSIASCFEHGLESSVSIRGGGLAGVRTQAAFGTWSVLEFLLLVLGCCLRKFV
jgi:hypothetical protein